LHLDSQKEIALFFLFNKFICYYINQEPLPKIIYLIDKLTIDEYLKEIFQYMILKFMNMNKIGKDNFLKIDNYFIDIAL